MLRLLLYPLLTTPLAAQVDYHAHVLWESPALPSLKTIRSLPNVASAKLGKAGRIEIRMRGKTRPDYTALAASLGPSKIWSLRPSTSTNPVDGLIRTSKRNDIALPPGRLKLLTTEDPRTQRRLRALSLLGQLRDLYAKPSKHPSQLAGSQTLLSLLPLIQAHIAVERKRGFPVKWKPLTRDSELPVVVAEAIQWTRTKKLAVRELEAMRNRKIRHAYYKAPQKLIQLQVEAAYNHYRYTLTTVLAEIEPTLSKLEKCDPTDPARIKFQALQTTLMGLRSLLR